MTERPAVEPATRPAPATATAALRRSGFAIAAGTLLSRVTGFLRTVVVGSAIGYAVGDAYNAANTIPNILYDLLLGGVLSAVVVPILVEAARKEADGGEAYAQRLISLVVVTLLAVSVVAVIFAPQVVGLYASSLHPEQRRLATTFGRFFLPQLLFYGAGGVITAVLNTRDRFAAPMWTPVLNNLIVIGTGAAFWVLVHRPVAAGDVHGTALLVLAIGTTAGIVVQTFALLPALHSAGVRLRLRLDLRGMGLRRAGGFAGWTLFYVLINQLGYLGITRLAISAGEAGGSDRIGLSAYTYAYVLFSLPYAVIGVTVVTAIFPAMSRSGDTGDLATVRDTLDRAVSLAGVLLVPASGALLAFGTLIMTILFAHGSISLAEARQSGPVLAAFGVGLVPFAAFQLQFRAWLSVRDARTPALINLATTAVNLLADGILYLALPPTGRVVGLAAGFSLSYFLALRMSTWRLEERIGSARRRGLVLRTHVRLILATLLALIPAYAVDRGLTYAGGTGPAMALLTLVVAVAIGATVFVSIARRLRVGELDALLATIRGRLRPAA